MTGHLIHIGLPKAGSTFLRRWFEANPHFAYSEGGLAGYRNVYDLAAEAASGIESRRWRATSCEKFSAPHPNARSFLIDYEQAMDCSWAERQSAVRCLLVQMFPDAHILIVTRGFRSMILSSYSQYVRSGGREDFETFNRDGFGDHPWNYDILIRGYRESFGPDRVILLPYELLRDDPGAFTSALEERLGLEPFPPSPEAVNSSLSPVELRWYPRLSRLVERLPVGSALRRKIRNRYFAAVDKRRLVPLVRLLQRIRPAQPFADSLCDELIESLRGCADSLAREPLYRRYAEEYFAAPATAAGGTRRRAS